MNPQTNTGNTMNVSAQNPNAPAAAGARFESAPNVPPMPEIAPVQNVEQGRFEQEQGLATMAPPATATPVPVPQPAVVTPVATPATPAPTTTATPAAAADTSLIEKEWVAKVKSTLVSTRSDPYAQAQQIAELMRDYVKKRYGKEVGKASEQ